MNRKESLRSLQAFGLAVVAVALSGCLGTEPLQVASAAQTGCAPDQIEITNDQQTWGARAWVAWCGGKPYQCSGAGQTYSCKAVYEDKPNPPPAASSSAPRETRANAAAWSRYPFDVCGISAEFPSDPGTMRTDQAKMHIVDLPLAQSRGDLTLACSALPRTNKPAKALLDGAREGMLKAVRGKLVKETDVLGGREVLFDVQGQQALARLLVLGDKIIVATALPVSAMGTVTAKRFVTSVQAVE